MDKSTPDGLTAEKESYMMRDTTGHDTAIPASGYSLKNLCEATGMTIVESGWNVWV